MNEAIEVVRREDGVSYVRLSVENFQLNAHSAWVAVWMYNDQSMLVSVERVYVPPQVYGDWSKDDDYIIDYVLKELDLQPFSPHIVFPAD